MRKFLRAIVLASALAGASAIPSANAQRIPFAQADWPEPRADMAIVYVYRTTAIPLAFSVGTYIDNEKRADLSGHSFTWFYVTPGTHRLKFRWPILAGSPTVQFDETFEAGQTYAYHYDGSVNFAAPLGSYNVTSRARSVDPGAAIAAVEDCCAYRSARADGSAADAPATTPSE
jgi:hypothetical protein